ncbi:DsbA family protein [Sphingomicrobium flavum]|uniref:DsbA family protein n=1 Tax=Sphingomicrobium flavum TaxID=1229164 RepID=UPI0021ADF2F6|nr:DsbA family protein [Sphingomicrobium flavum]
MSKIKMMLTASAVMALAACGSGGGEPPVADAPVEAVAAPDGGDWSEMVVKTEAGGFLMGNPDAPVKLVEYASYTCPACALFDQTGTEPLVENYVKTGRVSYEYRQLVRDPVDMVAAIVARCAGEARMFPITHALFQSQEQWFMQARTQLASQGAAIEALPENERNKAVAEAAGLITFASQRGVPRAEVEACLMDEQKATDLVEMRSTATQDYGQIGTPTFILNGVKLDADAQWTSVEPYLKRAVGEE